jgi:hypothetical protein
VRGETRVTSCRYPGHRYDNSSGLGIRVLEPASEPPAMVAISIIDQTQELTCATDTSSG